MDEITHDELVEAFSKHQSSLRKLCREANCHSCSIWIPHVEMYILRNDEVFLREYAYYIYCKTHCPEKINHLMLHRWIVQINETVLYADHIFGRYLIAVCNCKKVPNIYIDRLFQSKERIQERTNLIKDELCIHRFLKIPEIKHPYN
jgi:hypothetical protein